MESFLAAARAAAGPTGVADVSASTSPGLAWVGRAGVGALAVLLISALAFRRSFHLRSKPATDDETDLPAPVDDETPEVAIESSGEAAATMTEPPVGASMLALHGRVRETTTTPAGRKWVDIEGVVLGLALDRFAPEALQQAGAGDVERLQGQDPRHAELRRRLRGASDGDLVFALLTLHKLAEEAETDDRSRKALADEAAEMGATLERVAPAALEEGLATYFGDREANFETATREADVGASSDEDERFEIAALLAAPIMRPQGDTTTREESTMEAGVNAPLIRLCTDLAEATGAGQVDWVAREETSFRYRSASGGVDIRSRKKDGEPPYELVLFNSKKDKVDTLSSEWSEDDKPAPWNEPLVDLYRAARRRALGVDKIIDDLLAELRATTSASERADQPSGHEALLAERGLSGPPRIEG